MDAVFKALADPDPAGPARRAVRAGRPDAERARAAAADDAVRGDEAPARCSRRPASSSLGGAGREKLHFLNPVPIRLVHDRWVSKYAEPWAATLSDLKSELEDGAMEKMFEIYIKTTPERLWEAITDQRAAAQVQVRRRHRVRLDARVRATTAVHPGAPRAISEGENLEVDPPRRLVQSFRALWSDDVKRAGTSRVTWEIEPVGGFLPADGHPRPAARRTPTASSTAAGR